MNRHYYLLAFHWKIMPYRNIFPRQIKNKKIKNILKKDFSYLEVCLITLNFHSLESNFLLTYISIYLS